MVRKDLEAIALRTKLQRGTRTFTRREGNLHNTPGANGSRSRHNREACTPLDPKLTMLYYNLGLADQAKELEKLPQACQHIVSSTTVANDSQASLGAATVRKKVSSLLM